MNKKTRKTIGLLLIVVAMVWWMQDYRSTMQQTQVTLTADDIDSYTYEASNQKKHTALAIYKYDKQFVFVAKYTDGEQTKVETQALNQDQQTAFIKEISEKAATAVEDENANESSGVTTDGEYHAIYPIDLEKAGLKVTAVEDIDFSADDTKVEEPSKDVSNQDAMELVLKDKTLLVSLDAVDLEALIQQQFEEQTGSRLKEIRIGEQKEECFTIDAVGFDGKSYQANCSYAGYVTEITQ